jgi:hypothetical protein
MALGSLSKIQRHRIGSENGMPSNSEVIQTPEGGGRGRKGEDVLCNLGKQFAFPVVSGLPNKPISDRGAGDRVSGAQAALDHSAGHGPS